MNYEKVFYNFQETIFNIFIGISWLLLILTSLGIFDEYPEVFFKAAFYIKIYICIFLLWRFNPFRQFFVNKPLVFTNLDRKIAFSAGLFMLTTSFLKEYFFKIKSMVLT